MSAWRMTLDELVAGTQGRVAFANEKIFRGVGTDTRADLNGQIFVALKGDRFDAHDFLSEALAAGAAAVVVHRVPEDMRKRLEAITVIEVDDTLVALQRLGNFWRRKMKARILGVTGTNGKTTTKEFAAAMLESRRKVQWSKGSFNNHWGVPITLLTIDPTHEVAIIEMGMNHPGELEVLSKIAEPDVVVVTMVGRGHLEGVGSVEGVARAKAEIYEFAPEKAMRIFNLENEHTHRMFETWGKVLSPEKVLAFCGVEAARARGLLNPKEQVSAAWPALDVALEVVSATPESIHVRGEIQGVAGETTIPVFGRHNVTNLMTSAAMALACGFSPAEVWEALPLCRMAWGRNQWVKLACGARVLFDAYNANPESMAAAVENFAKLEAPKGGRKIAILGEMRELGEFAPELHRELGEKVAHAGFDQVSFVGTSGAEFEAGLSAGGFDKKPFITDTYKQELAPVIAPVLSESDLVLIKASRGVQLEQVLLDLKPLDFKTKK